MKSPELAQIAARETADLESAVGIIQSSYEELSHPSPHALDRLAAIGLTIPHLPVIVDAKKYYDLADDTDPISELREVWHGFHSFWLPAMFDYESKRSLPCFQRLEAIVPALVGHIDGAIASTNMGVHDIPDRLSLAIPLAAAFDMLVTQLIDPADPGVFLSDNEPRHNYLFS